LIEKELSTKLEKYRKIMSSFTLRYGGTLLAPGFGTWRCDESKLEDAVYHAISTGYRHLDCAQLYKNEHIVGRAISRSIRDGLIKSRKDLFITGKLAPSQMQAESVLPAIQKSLHDLFDGIEKNPDGSETPFYFDLFITHWPYSVDPTNTISPAPFSARRGYTPERYLSVWRALENAVDNGYVRALGVSNMSARKIHTLCGSARIQPSCLQVELHPFLAQNNLVNFCKRRGILVTGYSPLGSPGRPAAYRAEGDPDVLSAQCIVDRAALLNKTPAQVVLRWAMQRGTIPLPRSTTSSRIEENFLGALGGLIQSEMWSLNASDMAAIDALDLTEGSKGRIMKGDNFSCEGVDWRTLWDEDFVDLEDQISK
jgi:alcohol dehydrogenase (NADP+)